MKAAVLQFLKREEGATAVEYALLVSFIAGTIAVAVLALGGRINTVFQRITGLLR
jgi:pilus assembly protein Flp/PilA